MEDQKDRKWNQPEADDSWTDDLAEAIHRQTMKEQQEYGQELGEPLQEEALQDSGDDRNDAQNPSLESELLRNDMQNDATGDAESVLNQPQSPLQGSDDFRGEDVLPRRSRNFADPEEALGMRRHTQPEGAVLFDEVVDDADSESRKEKKHFGRKDKSAKKKDRRKEKPERKEKERRGTGKLRYRDENGYQDEYGDEFEEYGRRRGRRDPYENEDPEFRDSRYRNSDDDRYDRGDDRYDRRDRRGDRYDRGDDRYDRRDRRGDRYDRGGDRYDSGRSRRDRERGMSRQERREYEEFLAFKEQQGRGRKKKHRVRNFIITLLVLLFLVIPILAIAARMIGITQGVSTQDIKKLLSDEVKRSQETGAMAGYTNIALFGLDSTQQSLDSGNNRTDVMIIASINNKTGDTKLVSLYRDTYLDVGDGNYQKANAAYAFGGPEQAIKMINKNLDLNITDYVTVGFEGVTDLVDEVGGVEIDVQSDEIEHLNNYQSTMATELGKEYVPVTAPGVQTLNGLQATAYCRIRYTDGGDFKRTERQKEVLSKAFEKLKKSGPVTMIKAANSLSSEVRTSLNPAEIASLALKAMRFNISETNGFPNDQYRAVGYIGDQSCVIPVHLTDNVVWLHQYLFNDSSYQVSSTVQEISDQVSAKSGY